MYDMMKSKHYSEHKYEDWQVWLKLMLLLDKLEIASATEQVEEYFA